MIRSWFWIIQKGYLIILRRGRQGSEKRWVWLPGWRKGLSALMSISPQRLGQMGGKRSFPSRVFKDILALGAQPGSGPRELKKPLALPQATRPRSFVATVMSGLTTFRRECLLWPHTMGFCRDGNSGFTAGSWEWPPLICWERSTEDGQYSPDCTPGSKPTPTAQHSH